MTVDAQLPEAKQQAAKQQAAQQQQQQLAKPVLQQQQQHAATPQSKITFDKPTLVTLEGIRMVFIEAHGKFSDVSPKLWGKFHTDLAKNLTTTHRFIGAAFLEAGLCDDLERMCPGGIYRAGAIQESGTAVNHELAKFVREDVVAGEYLQFVVNGQIHNPGAAWKECFDIAKNFGGAGSLDVDSGRPILEIFLNVPEPDAEQREGGMITELLIPVASTKK